MSVSEELLVRICKSLAFHAVETELTWQFMTPPEPEYGEKIEEAKALIAEAGLDFDVLYPVSERPVAFESGCVEEIKMAG
jgi:hypothetical protein